VAATRYYQESQKWYKKLKNSRKIAKTALKITNILIEKALKDLRSIPAKDRNELGIDRKIDGIHELIEQNNQDIGSEMSLIATENIDISRYQNNAKLAVKGK